MPEPSAGSLSFDETSTAKFASVFYLSSDSPVVALDSGGEPILGIATVAADQLSPAAACYLWLWASLQLRAAVPTLDYHYMRSTLRELATAHPVEATLGTGASARTERIILRLTGDKLEGAVIPDDFTAEQDSSKSIAMPVLDPDDLFDTDRRVMLISLGPWVDEHDTWDESPWGGGLESRSGYGYRDGMTESELLNAARLFWKFNARSETWQGIEYAVVVHGGYTRAVLRITRFIGPFWGRSGFQGEIVNDPTLVAELVGKRLKGRNNPVTTWRGSD